MRMYETRYRDAAGYHRVFDATQADARETVRSLRARVGTDHPCPMDRGQEFAYERIDVPTDKAGLVSWLNFNAANADSF